MCVCFKSPSHTYSIPKGANPLLLFSRGDSPMVVYGKA
jgi:hypothetical protein